MMGAPDLFKDLLGDYPTGDISYNALAAKTLVKAGLSVVICQPAGKKPACTLDSRAAKRADLEAQKAAQEAGNRFWHKVTHDCGKIHAITDPKELNRARVKALLANGANVAVMAGAGTTRLMIVDLDTADQRRAFVAAWERETGEEFSAPMTVTSPGVRNVGDDGTENWIHKDGGHYWLTVPDDVEIPDGVGKYEGEGGWVVYVRAAYALVPPSVRPEGPYQLTGTTLEAPAWLLARLEAVAVEQNERRERAKERLAEGPGDIENWASATPWEELLNAAGWTFSGAHDTCGCPIWTRPGNPAHIKSATAHEAGCTVYDTSLGYGPIHAWSDEVRWGGQQTVNKLTFLAYTTYSGDMAAAMRSIGVEPYSMLPEPTILHADPFIDPPGPAGGSDDPKGGKEVTPAGDQTPPVSTSTAGERTPAELETAIYRLADRIAKVDARTRRAYPETLDELTARELERIRAREAAKTIWEAEQSPEEDLDQFLIDGDALDDLEPGVPFIPGVLNRESYAILSGRDGSMKTFVALDWALSLATGTPWMGKTTYPMADRPRVLFLVGEGQSGFATRVAAWKKAKGVTHLGGNFTALFRRINFWRDAPAVDWLKETVRDGGYSFVVIDHLRLISGGADGNSSDMGVVVDRVKDLVEATCGGSVLLIAHTDKTDTDTRGFSGIEDDSDTVWHAKASDDEDAPGLVLKNPKMKDGESHPQMALEPVSVDLGRHPETGEPITSLVLREIDPFAVELSNPNQARVLELVRRQGIDTGLTQAEIHKALGMPKTNVKRSVDGLTGGETPLLERHGDRYWIPGTYPGSDIRGEIEP